MYILNKLCIKTIQFLSYNFHKNINFHSNKMQQFGIVSDNNWGYQRLPDQIANISSKGIRLNSKFSAGMKLSFQTDADDVCFKVLYKKRVLLKHMSIKASCGLDIYVKNEEDTHTNWVGCFEPYNNVSMYAEKRYKLGQGDKNIIVYLPPFAQIDKLVCEIGKNNIFKQIFNDEQKTAVVYGSSITHGCAASRPSLSYSNLISRKMNMKVINMGFSESAKGDLNIINYISNLHPQAFIVEYDHNATLEELRNTHFNVYSTLRNGNEDALIILLTRLSGGISISVEEEKERINIIKDTYKKAISSGDKNIYLILGNEILPLKKEDYFVDDRHPNDRGMECIADHICKLLNERGFNENKN